MNWKFVVCAAAICSLSFGVRRMQAEPVNSTEVPAMFKRKVAFVTNGPSPFWTIALRGTEQAQREIPDLEVEFQTPADATAATQNRIVNDLLAKGVEGIAISPIDAENQTELLNSVARKTILITQDSDAPKSGRRCFVGTDNRAAGRMAGKEIRKALPKGGQIMLFVGNPSVQNARQRTEGIRDALKGSRVKILGVRGDNNGRELAKSNVEDVIKKHPRIAGLIGLWSYNGPAILHAVQAAHKIGKIKIVCFDEDGETLNGVKIGAIEATIVQQPYEFGYRSIKLLNGLLEGEAAGVPANHHLLIPTLAITRRNVDAFAAQLQKHLGFR